MRLPLRIVLALSLTVGTLTAVAPPAAATFCPAGEGPGKYCRQDEGRFGLAVDTTVRQFHDGHEVDVALSPSLPQCGEPGVEAPCWRDLAHGVHFVNSETGQNTLKAAVANDDCRTDVSPLPEDCTRFAAFAEQVDYNFDTDETILYDTLAIAGGMSVRNTDGEVEDVGTIVTVDLGPAPAVSASFTVQATGQPNEYRFTSTSTHSRGWELEHSWDFGDGSPDVDGPATVTHTFPGEGPFDVYLFVIDDQGIAFDDVTRQVDGEDSPLTASIAFPGRERAEVEVDEELEVVVTIALSDAAAANVTAINPTTADHSGPAPLLRFPEGTFEVVESDPVPEGGWELAPGTSIEVAHTLLPLEPGEVTLRTDLAGVGAGGQQVTAQPAERTIRVLGAGLDVDVAADPANVKLNGDTDGDGEATEADNHIAVDVTITNSFDQPVTDLAFLEPAAEPLKWTSLLPDEPTVGLRHLPGSDVPTDIADLPAGESVTLSYTLEAFELAIAELEAIVSGSLAGETVTGRGTDEVRVISNVLVEARFDVEDRPYISGQPVRVFGSLTNVSQVTGDDGEVIEEGVPIGVVVVPSVTGNGGGGHPFPADFAGRTPLGPQGFVVEPGEAIDIAAIVGTSEQRERSDVSIEYGVHVWAHETDEEGQRVYREGAPTQVEIVEEDGWSARHDVRLRFNEPVPDHLRACEAPTLLYTAGCGLVIGIENLARSLWDLAVFGVTEAVPGSWRAWGHAANLNQLAWQAVLGSDSAQQQLAAILEEDLRSLVEAGAIGAEVLAQIPQLSNAAIDEAIRVYEDGDLEAAAQYTGQALGENADAAFGPVLKGADAIVRARALKTVAEAATRSDGLLIDLLQVYRQNRRAELLERVAELRAAGRIQDLPTSGLLRAGDDVTHLPHVWRDGYGAGEEDVRYLLQIAEAHGVNIAFRSRHPRSLELLTTGRGWPKPQSTKLKTVSQLDIDYLGYRADTLATIELVEPPVDWRLTGPDLERALDAEMTNIANRYPELNADEDLFAQVRERLKLRTEEFESGVQDFLGFADEGVEVDFNYGFNNAPDNTFAPDRGTLDPEIAARRRARIGTVEGPDPSRRYFTLEMAGPDGTDFRPLTGDIDFVAILTPDGKLPSLDVRKRIYADLQKLLAMQHGESFSITLDRIRQKFLLPHVEGVDGSEALMVAGRDGRLRAGYFQDNRSITTSTPNSHLSNSAGDTDFLLIHGAPAEAVSEVTTGSVNIPSLTERLARSSTPHALVAPGKINLLVDRLEEQAVQGAFVRDEEGQLIRADRSGGLEQYLPPPDDGGGGNAAAFAQGTGDDPAVAALESFGVDRPVDAGGAMGGRWAPISVEEALAVGDPDALELAPMTVLPEGAAAGQSRVPLAGPALLDLEEDSPWFAFGDVVVVDPGGPGEEIAQVVAATAEELVLGTPLSSHEPGTTVALLEAGDAVVRVAGPSRFDTASTISSTAFDAGVPVAYVATGANFPDALAAGPVAGADDAPILLVGDAVPRTTAVELARLRPQRIVVLGGQAVVPVAVERELESLTSAPVERLAGTNRFETAAVVAEAAFEPGVEVAYVATGGAFPDALAAGPPAGMARGPVLLVGDELPAPTAAALERLEPARIVVTGGPNAVSDEVLDALGAFTDGSVDRVSGVSRVDTAAQVVADAYPDEVETVYVATGGNFPDALAGVPSAVLANGPLLLVGDDVPDSAAEQLTRLSPERIVVLGGAAAVPDDVVGALAGFVRR